MEKMLESNAIWVPIKNLNKVNKLLRPDDIIVVNYHHSKRLKGMDNQVIYDQSLKVGGFMCLIEDYDKHIFFDCGCSSSLMMSYIDGILEMEDIEEIIENSIN